MSKEVKPPLAEQKRYNRLTPIFLLLEQVKKHKKNIAGEDNLYEELLVVLGVELITSIRQGNSYIKPGKPPVFKSAWKQHIRLALDALGTDADYKLVANWIANNHPNSPLPRYCNPFLKVTRDLFELITKFPSVAEGVDRDVSYVRVRVKRWIAKGTVADMAD